MADPRILLTLASLPAAVGGGGKARLDHRGTVYYSTGDDGGGLLEFVYLAMFERTRQGVLEEGDIERLEDALLANPRAGAVLAGTGGVRKVRAAQRGRGKRGSARVAYLYVEAQATVYLVLAFPKNVRGALTAEQTRAVRSLAEAIRREPWPRARD